MGLST